MRPVQCREEFFAVGAAIKPLCRSDERIGVLWRDARLAAENPRHIDRGFPRHGISFLALVLCPLQMATVLGFDRQPRAIARDGRIGHDTHAPGQTHHGFAVEIVHCAVGHGTVSPGERSAKRGAHERLWKTDEWSGVPHPDEVSLERVQINAGPAPG